MFIFFKKIFIIKYINKKIAIHTKLSKEIIGNNDYHIGAIDELKRIKDYLNG